MPKDLEDMRYLAARIKLGSTNREIAPTSTTVDQPDVVEDGKKAPFVPGALYRIKSRIQVWNISEPLRVTEESAAEDALRYEQTRERYGHGFARSHTSLSYLPSSFRSHVNVIYYRSALVGPANAHRVPVHASAVDFSRPGAFRAGMIRRAHWMPELDWKRF